MNPEDFNYFLVGGKWFVGKENTSKANGLVNPENVADVILPRFHNGIKIYGTRYRCFYQLPALKTIFIPNNYRLIEADFCYFSTNVESITFEEDSQITKICHHFALLTKIKEISIPSSLKYFEETYAFYQCMQLKRIFFESNIRVNYDNLMFGDGCDPQIYVPRNYKHDLFCNKSVIKILDNTKRKCSAVRGSYLSRSPMFINILLLRSCVST